MKPRGDRHTIHATVRDDIPHLWHSWVSCPAGHRREITHIGKVIKWLQCRDCQPMSEPHGADAGSSPAACHPRERNKF